MKTLDPFLHSSLHFPCPSLYFNPLQDWPRLFTLPPTALCTRELKLLHTGSLHLDTVPGLHRRLVVAILDYGRVLEVLVEVVHVLQDALLPAHAHVVDGAQVLSVLREARPRQSEVLWER